MGWGGGKRSVYLTFPERTRQWTSVIDLTNGVVYYKTFDNNNIRMIDLKEIDFGKVKYQYQKLDEPNSQPVEVVTISQ